MKLTIVKFEYDEEGRVITQTTTEEEVIISSTSAMEVRTYASIPGETQTDFGRPFRAKHWFE